MDLGATHLPILTLVGTLVQGDVVEVGSGQHSTPLLVEWARDGREVYTLEESPEWHNMYVVDPPPTYHSILTDDAAGTLRTLSWRTPIFKNRWGIAFIDGKAASRAACIASVAHDASVVLVHDTEDDKEYIYQMASELARFPHRRDHVMHGVRTTIVSNYHHLQHWQLPEGE
jgi:hypothetical protein